MRYAQIDKCECCNGNNIGVSLFTQGCPIRCPHCHNASIWDFDGGKIWDKDAEQTVIDLLNKPYITRLSILGGEPVLDRNIQELAYLCSHVKQLWPQKKIWLWSGYLWEDIYYLAFQPYRSSLPYQQEWTSQEKEDLKNLLFNIDILVDGPFVQEKKDLTLKWRGSWNQRVINVPETLKQTHQLLPAPNPILYCD